MRIQEVQLALKSPARQFSQVTHEVTIDVVWVVFILDEGPIDEDVFDADLPELIDEDREAVHKMSAPGPIPVGIAARRTFDEHGRPQLGEG